MFVYFKYDQTFLDKIVLKIDTWTSISRMQIWPEKNKFQRKFVRSIFQRLIQINTKPFSKCHWTVLHSNDKFYSLYN